MVGSPYRLEAQVGWRNAGVGKLLEQANLMV